MKQFYGLIKGFGKRGWFFLPMLLIAFACSTDEETLNAYEKQVIAYFKEVALGFEFGSASPVTRKWVTPMKIFVGGNPSTEMANELTQIIDEINTLTSDGFEISTTNDSLQSNCYIFFGSGTDFANVFPPASNHVASNWGLFYVYFDGLDNLYQAVVYVDIVRATESNARKHLLREELTQSLGLAKDSSVYPESIFQSAWTTTTEYAEIDRDLIRLLYHPDITSGLDRNEVDVILRDLVTEL